MSDRPDRDLFDIVDSEIDREQAQNLSLVRFEETVVSRVLRHCRLEAAGPELRRRCRELTGRGQLLFVPFIAEYPSFPVFMAFDKVHYLHELSIEDWIRRLTKTAVYKKYEELRLLVPARWQDKPFALVIPTYNFGGVMLIHTTPAAIRRGCRRMTANVDGDIVTFEPLEDFLETQGWSP